MTAGSYCYIGPQGIVHGTMVCESFNKDEQTALQYHLMQKCGLLLISGSQPEGQEPPPRGCKIRITR